MAASEATTSISAPKGTEIDGTDGRKKPTIVFVLGPPGSGKGTLCKLTADQPRTDGYVYQHLSTGDYLRELGEDEALCAAEGFDIEAIRFSTRENQLLSSDKLIPVLKYKIDSTPEVNVWLIDGFPRNMETTLAFEEKVGKPTKLFVLDCPREVAARRFLSRRREKADVQARFDRRYDEYVENMKAIGEHYSGVTTTIRADASREECFEAFVRALR